MGAFRSAWPTFRKPGALLEDVGSRHEQARAHVEQLQQRIRAAHVCGQPAAATCTSLPDLVICVAGATQPPGRIQPLEGTFHLENAQFKGNFQDANVLCETMCTQ
eukprot:scaffold46463_cov19-Tisochrysis_lutea.AAC.2